MCDNVIILEIKSNYALAMKKGGETIRIKLKDGMEPGQSVYILPEDIYEKENNSAIPVSFYEKRKKIPSYIRSFTAIAAALAIIIGVMFSHHAPEAYALASIDGAMNIQLELDRDNRVLSASSLDGQLGEDSVENMKGMELSNISPILKELLGRGPVLLACAGFDDEENEAVEQLLRDIFSENTVLYLSGNSEDITLARKNNISLGFYLAGEVITENHFELLDSFVDAYSEYLEDSEDNDDENDISHLEKMSFEELVKEIEENPEYTQNEEVMELLADKVEDMHEAHREDGEESDEDDDSDDESDDSDENEEDD